MNAIAYNLISGRQGSSHGADMVDSTLKTAMSLEQWDVRVPDTAISDTATLYRIFQAVNNATSIATIRKELDAGLLQTFKSTLNPSIIERTLKSKLRTVGVLAEIDDVVTSRSTTQLTDAWNNIRKRSTGLISARFVDSFQKLPEMMLMFCSSSDVKSILCSREILMSTLSANRTLRDVMRISLQDARKLQTNALLSSCEVWRRRHNSQQSLEAVTCLADLIPICATIGLDISRGAQNAISDVLWTQGEFSTSIRMLQVLVDGPRQKDAPDDVQQSSLLAKLGHHVAEARLESPDQIMSNYLVPAIQQLKNTKGDVAGQVYHQFATFCYDQLQNQDSNDDLTRATKLRNRRQAEYDAIVAEVKSMRSQSERKTRESDLRKARKW
jgi:ataxia telangiectasia mutated family protein